MCLRSNRRENNVMCACRRQPARPTEYDRKTLGSFIPRKHLARTALVTETFTRKHVKIQVGTVRLLCRSVPSFDVKLCIIPPSQCFHNCLLPTASAGRQFHRNWSCFCCVSFSFPAEKLESTELKITWVFG